MLASRLSRILPPATAAAIAVSTLALTGPAAAEPATSPAAAGGQSADCPYRVWPAPAVDESEVVAPGEASPTALAVPDEPVGGARLGECGVVADPAAGPLPAGLNSQGWLIADLESGDVIAAKDPHGRFRPASTIKVLLAILALEHLDLDAKVEVTANDWSMEGDACGVGPGGQYTVRDMVTGLLIVSGNDCANALARQLGGYRETLDLMNARARELGALDTRAATPSGLDAAGMSSSPYDLAVLFREAMRHPTFREVMAMRGYDFPGYPARKDVPGDVDHPGYWMDTSNPLLRDGYPGMLGGKTGYTDDALKTFVGAAERDGRKVLIVQMYGLTTEGNTYADQAARMFDYGFAAPAGISVGSLAAADGSDVSPYAEKPQPQAAHNQESSGSTWVTVGSVIAILAAALLAAIAVRMLRRRRG